MTLTKPDFHLSSPNTLANVTDMEWWFWLRLHELEPKTQLGGIYANKSGFHNRGDKNVDHGLNNAKTNYSIRYAPDRFGPGMTHASGLDWTFPDAQSGHYGTIDKYSSRLMKSALDQNDPRLDLILFEFYGQTDSDAHVEGYDEYREEQVTSDSSHLWHIHFSFHRSKCNDGWAFWALLTVVMGWTVAQWKATLPANTPAPPVKPKPPAGLPVHANGSRENKAGQTGTDIRTLQIFIGSAHMGPADGKAGAKFTAGVRWYQSMRGYHVDGIAGKQTWAPILKALS